MIHFEMQERSIIYQDCNIFLRILNNSITKSTVILKYYKSCYRNYLPYKIYLETFLEF